MKELYEGDNLGGIVYKPAPNYYRKSNKSGNNIIKIEAAMIVNDSPKAYKIKIGDQELWIPKSVIGSDCKPAEWWLKKEKINAFYKKK